MGGQAVGVSGFFLFFMRPTGGVRVIKLTWLAPHLFSLIILDDVWKQVCGRTVVLRFLSYKQRNATALEQPSRIYRRTIAPFMLRTPGTRSEANRHHNAATSCFTN